MAADADRRPVAATEAERLLAPLANAGGVALAVSGGADSTALMHLAAAWRGAHRPDLEMTVLTVDHGLRPESAGEAEVVAGRARGLGLGAAILTWDGPKPATGIQDAARRARYRLMGGYCAAHGLTHLLTAHHLDDQAETVLMRLARGSGLDGLAGMAAEVPLEGPVLFRPFLDVARARLEATVLAAGGTWIEDPSNDSDAFSRVRWRRLMPALAAEGLTARRLGEVARRFARARAALDAAAAELHRGAVAGDDAGYCRIDRSLLSAAPGEVALRVVAKVAMGVGGSGEAPRLARLERLCDRLREPDFSGATLARCRFAPSGGVILACREAGRAPPVPVEVGPGDAILWDGRFRIRVDAAVARGTVVRPLGADGVARLRASSALRRMPAAAARSTPGVFVGSELFAAPQIEDGRGPFSPPGVAVDFIGAARFAGGAA